MCGGCNCRKKQSNSIGYCSLHNESKDAFTQSYPCGDSTTDSTNSSVSQEINSHLLLWNTFQKPSPSILIDTTNPFSFIYENEEYVRVRDVARLVGSKEISFYKSGDCGWRNNRIRFNYKTNARAITYHGHFLRKHVQSSNGVQCILKILAEAYLKNKFITNKSDYFVRKDIPLFEGHEVKF